ncbi:hypothetical protein LBMAG15_12360 [Actinomycetes bacterium]|nr:hypothetical protein LBMAG15_12360 [Actinomycetes bacterium]
MRFLLALLFAMTLLSGCGQQGAFEPLVDGPCTANQDAAVTKHLSAQIDAFAARDWELAYSYASANFRKVITLAEFTEIIQAQYGMLIENKGYSFGSCEISAANILRQVSVASDQGDFSLDYKLSFVNSRLGVESAVITQLTEGLSL